MNNLLDQSLNVQKFDPNNFLLQNIEISKGQENIQLLSLNNDNSIMLVQYFRSIRIYQLKENNIKLIQRIERIIEFENVPIPKQSQFMKKSNEFCSILNSIIFQSTCGLNNCKFLVKQHLGQFSFNYNDVLINQAENTIILSSNSGIVIYEKQFSGWLFSQYINLKFIYYLTLNNTEQYLICFQMSLKNSSCILVFKQCKSNQIQQMNIIQNINVDHLCFGLQFFDEGTFACLSRKKIQIFKVQIDTNQFNLLKVIHQKNGDNFFHDQAIFFIQKKKVLMQIHSNCISILEYNQKDEFAYQDILGQNFVDSQFPKYSYGFVSSCGQYLILWNSMNNLVKIWKYIEQKQDFTNEQIKQNY